jgi:putative sterol carrier protein
VHEVGSDSWVAAFAAAVEEVAVDPAARVVVQQELADTGAAWHVVVDGGRASVAAGHHPSPDVTFTQDLATATAIAAGSLSAQEALVDGRLRVRGAIGRLTGPAAAALAALPPPSCRKAPERA